jgi:cAMP phosphodiesterase
MRLKILGCSGGIGSGLRTTSFLLDDDILIDVGTGIGDLTLDEMRKIQHILITHSHLDHIAGLPLLVDTLFSSLKQPLIVHALPETIDAMQKHIFNWIIWPDFSVLPTAEKASIKFVPMVPSDSLEIDGRIIQMIKVEHAVPAVAYSVTSATGALAFSGDTDENETLWAALNKMPRLDLLVVECGFSNEDEKLSHLAQHYCPRRLGRDIAKLKHNPKIWITHLKSGDEKRIFAECVEAMPDRDLAPLETGVMLTV